MPNVLTGNLLASGEVVYLASDGGWIVDLTGASIADDAEALALLKLEGERAVARQHVTGVYAMDVVLADGKPQPLSMREKIRAAHRPTV